MERIIDSELRGLESMIAQMCELARGVVSTALHESLHYGDSYDKIRETSDYLMILADQVEDKAVEIILKFQPVASDLRIVKTFMRISYDLARLGRYALDIAYVNRRFNGVRGCEEWIRAHIKDMSQKVMSMIELMVASIKERSLRHAKEASELEREVDGLHKSFLGKIAENASESRTVVSGVLIVSYLERMADHMVYAYEALIYMVTGKRELIE
jgi:phosphate transport system protein